MLLPLHREMVDVQSHGMSVLYGRDPRALSLATEFVVPSSVRVNGRQTDMFSRGEPAQVMRFELETDDYGRVLREVGRISFGSRVWDKLYDWYYDQEDGGMTFDQEIVDALGNLQKTRIQMWQEGSIVRVADTNQRYTLATTAETGETTVKFTQDGNPSSAIFTYNAEGQLVSIADGDYIVLHEYDDQGRISRIIKPARLMFGSNPHNSVTNFTYSADGHRVTYEGEFLNGVVDYDEQMRPLHVHEVDGAIDMNQTTLEATAEYAA